MSQDVSPSADPSPEAHLQVVPRQEAALLPPGRPARRKRWRSLCLVALLLVALGLIPAAPWFWYRQRAKEEWQQAKSSLARYDLPTAATHLDRYLALRPGDADGWFLAARTARRRQRVAEAEHYLERCQQLRGVNEATRLEWDLLRVQQGDLGEIDARLRESVTPEHPDALLVLEALARGYLRVERLADAIQACDLWIARQPEHPWPWLWRGGVYERLTYLDKALPDYQRAVRNAPDDVDARLALGGLLLRQRKPSAAAEQYESVLGRTPDDLAAEIGLASCRIEQGRAEEAIPLLDHALEQSPTSPQALFLRGKVAFAQDQLPSAERYLRESLRQAPHDPETLYQLSLVLRGLRQEDEAADLARRVDRLRKDHVRLDELTRMIARKPNDPRPRHEAGVIALRVGRTDEGLRWLHSVLRLGGDHHATHAALMEYYRQSGDPERAEHHQSLAETP